MAFSGSFVCTSFKSELLQGLHNFATSGGNTFNLALYTNSAAGMDATLAAYTPTNEVVGTAYVAGGAALTIPASIPGVSGTTAWVDFNDQTWSASTIAAARGGVIYNTTTSPGTRTCAILDFGADKSSSAGDFTMVFPAAAAATAIIRIA